MRGLRCARTHYRRPRDGRASARAARVRSLRTRRGRRPRQGGSAGAGAQRALLHATEWLITQRPVHPSATRGSQNETSARSAGVGLVITPSAPSAGKTRRHGTGNKSQQIPVTGPRGWFSVFYITRVYRALDCVYTWLKTHTVNTTYISAGFLRPASATPPSHTHRAPPRAPAPRGACVCTLQLELVGLSTLPLHASSGPNQKRAAAKRRCQSVPVRTGTERRTTRGPRRNAVPVSPPPATTCTTRGRPRAARHVPSHGQWSRVSSHAVVGEEGGGDGVAVEVAPVERLLRLGGRDERLVPGEPSGGVSGEASGEASGGALGEASGRGFWRSLGVRRAERLGGRGFDECART